MFILFIFLISVIAIILPTYNRFYALLFLIPLSVYSQSASVITFGSRGVNFGMDTAYIFIIIIIEGLNFKKQNLKLSINKSGLLLILCFIYFFLNALFSSLFNTGGITLSGILVYIRLFQYVPIYIILYNTPIDFKKSVLVLRTFVWTGVSASLLAIYQLFSGNFSYMKGMPSFTFPIFRESVDAQIKPGTYAGSANYNIFAAFLLISFFLNIAILKSKNKKVGYEKYIFILCLLILLIGFYTANSRAAILAPIIGYVFLNFNLSKLINTFRNLLMVFFLVFIFFYFLRESILINSFTGFILDFNDALPYAMDNVTYDSRMGFSGDTLGAVVRIFGYYEAIRVFLIYPIFGCGFDLFLTQSVHYPENLFLQILAETGLVGFLLYIFFVIRLYKDAKKLPILSNFNNNYILAFQAIIISLVFVNMTGATLFIQKAWGPFLIISGFFYAYQRTTIGGYISNG